MKKLIELIKGITPATKARIVSLLASLISLVASFFVNNAAFSIISIIAVIILSILAAWKNNDITELAQLSGKIFEILKNHKNDIELVEKISDLVIEYDYKKNGENNNDK